MLLVTTDPLIFEAFTLTLYRLLSVRYSVLNAMLLHIMLTSTVPSRITCPPKSSSTRVISTLHTGALYRLQLVRGEYFEMELVHYF